MIITNSIHCDDVIFIFCIIYQSYVSLFSLLPSLHPPHPSNIPCYILFLYMEYRYMLERKIKIFSPECFLAKNLENNKYCKIAVDW